MSFMTTWTIDNLKVVSSIDKLLLVSGRLNEVVNGSLLSSDFLVLVDIDEKRPLVHNLIHDKVSILISRNQYKEINELMKHQANFNNQAFASLRDKSVVGKLTKKEAGVHIKHMRFAIEDWNRNVADQQQKEGVQ